MLTSVYWVSWVELVELVLMPKILFSHISICKKAIHALTYSWLDYCNAFYAGISQISLHQLSSHITSVLAPLHLLPVRFQINFALLTIKICGWSPASHSLWRKVKGPLLLESPHYGNLRLNTLNLLWNLFLKAFFLSRPMIFTNVFILLPLCSLALYSHSICLVWFYCLL